MINSFYDPIVYAAKTVNVNAPDRLMTDIFKNYTAYFKKVANNYNIITHYIQGSPRPEVLSYELYGNTQLYWLLLMANDIYDPYHGWIKSQEACYQSVKSKSPNPEDTIAYHVDIKGEKYYNLIQYTPGGQWFDKGDLNREYPQYSGSLAAVSEYEAALYENEKKREIKIIAPSDIDSFISDLIDEMERNLT